MSSQADRDFIKTKNALLNIINESFEQSSMIEDEYSPSSSQSSSARTEYVPTPKYHLTEYGTLRLIPIDGISNDKTRDPRLRRYGNHLTAASSNPQASRDPRVKRAAMVASENLSFEMPFNLRNQDDMKSITHPSKPALPNSKSKYGSDLPRSYDVTHNKNTFNANSKINFHNIAQHETRNSASENLNSPTNKGLLIDDKTFATVKEVLSVFKKSPINLSKTDQPAATGSKGFYFGEKPPELIKEENSVLLSSQNKLVTPNSHCNLQRNLSTSSTSLGAYPPNINNYPSNLHPPPPSRHSPHSDRDNHHQHYAPKDPRQKKEAGRIDFSHCSSVHQIPNQWSRNEEEHAYKGWLAYRERKGQFPSSHSPQNNLKDDCRRHKERTFEFGRDLSDAEYDDFVHYRNSKDCLEYMHDNVNYQNNALVSHKSYHERKNNSQFIYDDTPSHSGCQVLTEEGGSGHRPALDKQIEASSSGDAESKRPNEAPHAESPPSKKLLLHHSRPAKVRVPKRLWTQDILDLHNAKPLFLKKMRKHKRSCDKGSCGRENCPYVLNKKNNDAFKEMRDKLGNILLDIYSKEDLHKMYLEEMKELHKNKPELLELIQKRLQNGENLDDD